MSNQLMTHAQSRKIILKLILFQFSLGTFSALIFTYFFGLSGFLSAMMGTVSVCSGTIYIYIKVFFRFNEDLNASFRLFYRSSMIKLVLSAIVAVVFIISFDVVFLPFIGGIIVTIMAYLFMLIVEIYFY
jgi:F0F1-type ATP synthase assembly protein I